MTCPSGQVAARIGPCSPLHAPVGPLRRNLCPASGRRIATMARSTRDTLIFATILLTPMAVATAYIASMSPEQTVIRETVYVEVPQAVAVEDEDAEPIAEPIAEPAAPTEPVHQPEVVRPAGAGMLVYEGKLVLTTKPDVAWAHGKLRSPDVDFGIVATRAVDRARLPEDLQTVADARVVLYRADGGTCTAQTTPSQLQIYGRQDGDVIFPEAENGEPSPAELLEARKEVFAEAQLLLSRLSPARCDGLWARRADLPAPAVFAERTVADDALAQQVQAAIAGLPDVLAVAAEYETYRGEHKALGDDVAPWSTFLKETTQVTRWDEIGGTRSYLNVIVGDGGEACSDDFWGRTALLLAIEGDRLVPQDQAGFLHPLALMDLERDGQLEAVTAGGDTLASNGPAGDVQSFTIPYHGCPC